MQLCKFVIQSLLAFQYETNPVGGDAVRYFWYQTPTKLPFHNEVRWKRRRKKKRRFRCSTSNVHFQHLHVHSNSNPNSNSNYICFLQRQCQIHLSQPIEYRWVAQIKHKNSWVLHANGITSSRNAADNDKRQAKSKQIYNKTTFSECVFYLISTEWFACWNLGIPQMCKIPNFEM